MLLQVLVNAGQANAATGDQGAEDCTTSADALSQALSIPVDQVRLVVSSRVPARSSLVMIIACCVMLGRTAGKDCSSGGCGLGACPDWSHELLWSSIMPRYSAEAAPLQLLVLNSVSSRLQLPLLDLMSVAANSRPRWHAATYSVQ